MNFNWRRGLYLSVGLSISVALLLLWRTFDLEVFADVSIFSSGALGLAGAMLLLAIGIEGRRISLLATAMGVHIRWFKGCTFFLSCSFAQLVTPMGLGEIPALTYLYSKSGLKLGLSLAAAVVRNFVTKLVFSAGVLLFIFTVRGRIPYGPVTSQLFTVVALVFAATLLVNSSYVLFPRLAEVIFAKLPRSWREGRLGKWQQRLEAEAKEFGIGLKVLWARGPLLLLRILFLSLCFWVIWFGMLPVLAWGLGIRTEPLTLIGSQFILTLALPFIPVPGASGALELAMAATYQHLVPRGLLALFILAWRFFSYYLLVILGAAAALGSLWGSARVNRVRG